MFMTKYPCVYILASKPRGVLYICVTANILRRGYEHQNELYEGFTKKYHIHRLVYFENHDTFAEAFERESNLKAWRRDWKIELIEKDNPEWRDLYPDIV